MNYYKALRVLALRDVLAPDPSPAYGLRRALRWYSRTFHTPLHLVAELPLHDVLVAYYEAAYEGLEEAELEKERAELALTDRELAAAAATKDRDAVANLAFEQEAVQEAAAAEAAAARRAAKAAVTGAADTAPARPALAPRGLDPVALRGPAPAAALPAAGGDSFRMTFMDLADLERLAASDGIGVEPLVGLK